jgi:hypothetical protein
MMTDLEDLIMSEAHRQGVKASEAAVRQASTDLAGSTLIAQGLIAMPGKGTISTADFVRSLRNQMPQAFVPVTDKPATSEERRTGETLTSYMRRQVEAGPKRPLPEDWDQVRTRVSGLTARMMDEVASKRRRAP